VTALKAAVFVVLALTFAGCRTREDGLRKVAREAAVRAETICRDAGDFDSCRAAACSEACSQFADSAGLLSACGDRCMARGTCDSDADCRPPQVCVTIAPRVRRCQLHTAGAAGP
jgi:hypothetical protein